MPFYKSNLLKRLLDSFYKTVFVNKHKQRYSGAVADFVKKDREQILCSQLSLNLILLI